MNRPKRTIFFDDEISVRLSWYAPGEVMDEHRHEFGQVSVLMAGAFREISDARTADNETAHIGFKAAGLAHANLYSETGALILSINFASDETPALAWNWQPARAGEIALARQLVMARQGEADVRARALDLVSHAVCARPLDRLPPGWARQLRDRLNEEGQVDLDRAAREYGIHRAHLSRGFRQWFGAPPSLYGLRCRMNRAVSALARGESAARAASAAGFADQSHLIRTLKRETGLTPRHFERLIAA